MKNILIITSVLLFVTAALLTAAFICNMNINSFLPENGSETPTQSPDDTNDASAEQAILILYFVFGLIPSFSWPVIAVYFTVVGILLLTLRTESLKGWLIATIVVSSIGFAVLGLSAPFLMALYVNSVPFLAAMFIAIVICYVASFVTVCIGTHKLRRFAAKTPR